MVLTEMDTQTSTHSTSESNDKNRLLNRTSAKCFSTKLKNKTNSCGILKKIKKFFVLRKRLFRRTILKSESSNKKYININTSIANARGICVSKNLRSTDLINNSTENCRSLRISRSILRINTLEFSESLITDNISYCRSSTILESVNSDQSYPPVINLEIPEDLSMVKKTSKEFLVNSMRNIVPDTENSKNLSYRKAIPIPLEKNYNNVRRDVKCKGLIPKTLHKIKQGIIVSKNKIHKKKSHHNGVKGNLAKSYICKQSYRKSKSFSRFKTDSLIKKGLSLPHNLKETKNNTNILRVQSLNVRHNSYTEQRNVVRQNTQPDTNNNADKSVKEILNYSYIAVDDFFTALEQLYENMELVRNGIQQLVDYFTHPPPVNVGAPEDRVVQFQHSIRMLQGSVEKLQFSVFKLPLNVRNLSNILLPCKCKIFEFNEYIQALSVDFEHAQYFNNDCPMLMMLKMIVIINLLRSVMNRGRNAFHRSISTGHVGRIELSDAFDLQHEHKRYVKPTFDLLYTRTRGMMELSSLSNVLGQAWQQSMNWDTFLPYLQLYISMIETLKPLFLVPNDWFVVRVLPETRCMHMFDGFISEFYRAAATQDFAVNNPIAFGAIFNVLKHIIDKIIEQHVAILGDLRNISLTIENANTRGNYVGNDTLQLPVYVNVNGLF